MAKPASTYDVDILRRIEDTTLNDQDLARNAQILNDFKASDSEISSFFKDKYVFLTGATGFVGKVFLEKLLRSCPKIQGVIILIRAKKGKTVQQITDELFKQVVFDRLKKEQPNFRHKVITVEGDFELMKLGLSTDDYYKIQQRVSVIINSAATIKFQDPFRKTVRINVRGTAELLKLATGCPLLESFVHLSTAFSFGNRNEINEQFYEPPMKPIDLIELVENTNEDTLEKMVPKMVENWENKYIYSKAVSEDLIREYGSRIPICMIRPSIIVSTYREPIRGWTDNIYGAAGVPLGAGIGFLHVFYCDVEKHAEIVPVDMVVNHMLVCAWHTAKEGIRSNGPVIHNYVSSPEMPITWGEYCKHSEENGINIPTVHAIWYYSFMLVKNWNLYLFLVAVLHFIPAYIIDTLDRIRGKTPRMVETYKKALILNENLKTFSTTNWKFINTNVQNLWSKLNLADKYIYHFNISELDWERFFETYLTGIRVYILKDPINTVPEARIKWKRLKRIHQATKAISIFIVLWFVWFLLTNIFM